MVLDLGPIIGIGLIAPLELELNRRYREFNILVNILTKEPE